MIVHHRLQAIPAALLQMQEEMRGAQEVFPGAHRHREALGIFDHAEDAFRTDAVPMQDFAEQDIDQAFIAATYESRITQYGRAAITKAALLSIRSQLQALLPPFPSDDASIGEPARRAIPFQQPCKPADLSTPPEQFDPGRPSLMWRRNA